VDWKRTLLGPTTSPDVLQKRKKCQESNPDLPAHSLVTTLTELILIKVIKKEQNMSWDG
jgi:hypothetical protein